MSNAPLPAPSEIRSEEERQSPIEAKHEIVDSVAKENPTFIVYKPSNITSAASACECVYL